MRSPMAGAEVGAMRDATVTMVCIASTARSGPSQPPAVATAGAGAGAVAGSTRGGTGTVR